MAAQTKMMFSISTRVFATCVFSRSFSGSAAACRSSQVGFVGLGNMGGPMALNLIKKGHELVSFDLEPTAVSALKAAGATIAPSPKEVAATTKQIVTMLPNNAAVRQVYTGRGGLLESVRTGTVLIDSSTVSPDVSKEMSKMAADKGAIFLDAPVSGGVNAASAATLTFMVGGDKSQYESIRPLLLAMGKNVVHCGPVGSGQAAKICNNMLLAVSMVGTAETMNLGIKLGLDPKLLATVLNNSSGRCWSSEVYNPVPGVMDGVPSSNEYKGGFGVGLMAKDLGLAQDAATGTSCPIPLGALAHQVYRMMLAAGYRQKDFSSVFQYLQETDKSL